MAILLTHDCIEQICYHINDDITTLHSCILLNRTWSSVAIDYLWREPFAEIKPESLKKIIDTYFLFMQSQQAKSHSPLFQYPSYLRQVNLILFHKAIANWVKDNQKEDSIYRMVNAFVQIIILHSNRLTSIVIDDVNGEWAGRELGRGLGTLLEKFIQSNVIWQNIRKLHIEIKSFCLRFLLPASEVLEEVNVAQLWYKEDCTELGKFLRRQKKLKNLTIHITGGFQLFISSLNGNEVPALRKLEFDNIIYWDTPITFLNHFPNLEYLEFKNCGKVTIEINPDVPICRHLLSLLLSETVIPVAALYYILQDGSKLHSFQYTGVNIPTRDLDVILTLLGRNCPSLKILDIQIQKQNIDTLVHSLTTLTKLKELKLWYPENFSRYAPLNVENYLENLGSALPNTLDSLDLQANWAFSPECLKKFFKSVNMKLNYLYIGMCDIQHCHVGIIDEFLSKRKLQGKQIKIDYPIGKQ